MRLKEEEKESILKKKRVRERENNEGREKDTHRAVLMNYLSNYLKGKKMYTEDSLVTELSDILNDSPLKIKLYGCPHGTHYDVSY